MHLINQIITEVSPSTFQTVESIGMDIFEPAVFEIDVIGVENVAYDWGPSAVILF